MGSAEEETAGQWGEEDDMEEEEEEGKTKKKKKGMCAKLLKFFASLGGQYHRANLIDHYQSFQKIHTLSQHCQGIVHLTTLNSITIGIYFPNLNSLRIDLMMIEWLHSVHCQEGSIGLYCAYYTL